MANNNIVLAKLIAENWERGHIATKKSDEQKHKYNVLKNLKVSQMYLGEKTKRQIVQLMMSFINKRYGFGFFPKRL